MQRTGGGGEGGNAVPSSVAVTGNCPHLQRFRGPRGSCPCAPGPGDGHTSTLSVGSAERSCTSFSEPLRSGGSSGAFRCACLSFLSSMAAFKCLRACNGMCGARTLCVHHVNTVCPAGDCDEVTARACGSPHQLELDCIKTADQQFPNSPPFVNPSGLGNLGVSGL